MQDTTENYIHLEKVSKIYGTKEVKIIAVDEISFNIAKGEFAVIVGPSGAGKTTVLNILGGMDSFCMLVLLAASPPAHQLPQGRYWICFSVL